MIIMIIMGFVYECYNILTLMMSGLVVLVFWSMLVMLLLLLLSMLLLSLLVCCCGCLYGVSACFCCLQVVAVACRLGSGDCGYWGCCCCCCVYVVVEVAFLVAVAVVCTFLQACSICRFSITFTIKCASSTKLRSLSTPRHTESQIWVEGCPQLLYEGTIKWQHTQLNCHQVLQQIEKWMQFGYNWVYFGPLFLQEDFFSRDFVWLHMTEPSPRSVRKSISRARSGATRITKSFRKQCLVELLSLLSLLSCCFFSTAHDACSDDTNIPTNSWGIGAFKWSIVLRGMGRPSPSSQSLNHITLLSNKKVCPLLLTAWNWNWNNKD